MPIWGYAVGKERRAELVAKAVPMAPRGSFEAPEEIDPRPFHTVENQQQIGSCQGHAISSCMEHLEHIVTAVKSVPLSRWWAYRKTQEIDGIYGDSGSTIAGGVEMAETVGCPPEELCPYPESGRYIPAFNPNSAAKESALERLVRSHSVLNSYEEIFDYLATGQGAVTFGCMWGIEPRNGIISVYQPGGGGHANCFLGYSKRKDTKGRNYLWDLNSWGESWGNGGWAEWSPDAVESMVNHRFSVAIGVSDMTTPEHRLISWDTLF